MPEETAARSLEQGLQDLFSGSRHAEAFSKLRAAAESGDAQGQYLTGMLYYLGKGTRQDLAQSVLWLTRAAQQGHADAQYELGERCASGEGTAQDAAAAARWYRKAADQKHVCALAALGPSRGPGSAAGFSCNVAAPSGVDEA